MTNLSDILESLTANHKTIKPFDREVAGLIDGNALQVKPTTIKEINPITGEAQTFIVQTVRKENGDTCVILEFVGNTHVRLILPSRVVSTVMRQADALSAKQRSNHSKRVMKERMAAGYKPKPPKRKGTK